MEKVRFQDGGREVTIVHDSEGMDSSYQYTDAYGVSFDTLVPKIDERGCPSMKGRQPTMEDLRELAMLELTYLSLLRSETARNEMAAFLAIPFDDDQPTHVWLRIAKAAYDAGFTPSNGDTHRSTQDTSYRPM